MTQKHTRSNDRRGLPPIIDYSDYVTDEHLDKIDELVNQEEIEEGTPIDGPAW